MNIVGASMDVKEATCSKDEGEETTHTPSMVLEHGPEPETITIVVEPRPYTNPRRPSTPRPWILLQPQDRSLVVKVGHSGKVALTPTNLGLEKATFNEDWLRGDVGSAIITSCFSSCRVASACGGG